MLDHAHYQRVWRVLRLLAGGALRGVFGYRCEQVTPDAPNYLVVVNHNTDLDPALVGLAFPRQMYFLASEHVFRKGVGSALLNYLFKPISRMKGATDAEAAMSAIRMLRKGYNLCLFAEGNRSFNGVTGPIFPATGKLAKASGAALVTFRLTGGYLTTPRWSLTRRTGRMRGACVNVYSAGQLKGMTVDEVNAAIRADLFEDAFLRQETEACHYRGRRLAEGLEDALFCCPVCKSFGMLRGHGDVFSCTCGMRARYNDMGFFEEAGGKTPPFSNIRDWDAWQWSTLCARLDEADEEVRFTNDKMRLVQIGADHEEQTVSSGRLTMDRDALTLGERAFPVGEIADMALVGPTRVVFTATGAHYEIASDAPRYCGRKYLLLYRALKERDAQ